MHNTVVIGTRHENLGKCNAYELLKIIENINPDVIFTEIPQSYFNQYYIEFSLNNLESETIITYLKEKSTVQIVPVDSENIPSDAFFQAYFGLMKKIEGSILEEGFHYRNYIDSVRNNISELGFTYLNSRHYMAINIEINKIIESILIKFDDEALNNVYKKWNEINRDRENIMLRKINNFCKTNKFERAVFMIGAGHLNSILEKVKEIQISQNSRLKWSFIIQ